MANCNNNEKQSLSKGWIKVPSKTYPNKVYYYNIKTKCSSWTNPCEGSDTTISDLTVKNIKKNLDPTSMSSLPLMNNRRKKKKKKKSNMTGNLCEPDQVAKINNNIEDYDEHQEQYFESVLSKAVNASQQKCEINSSSSVKKDVLDETDNKTFKFSSMTNSSKSSNYNLFDSKQDSSSFENIGKKIVLKKKKNSSLDNCKVPELAKNKTSKNYVLKPFSGSSFKTEKPKEGKISFKIGKTPAQNHLLKYKETLLKNAVSGSKEIDVNKYILRGKMPSHTEATKEYSTKEKTPAQVKLFKLRKDLMDLYKVKETEKEVCKQSLSIPNKTTTPLIFESMDLKDNLSKKEKEENFSDKTPAQTQLINLRRQLSRHPEDSHMTHPLDKPSLNETPPLHSEKSFQTFNFPNTISESRTDGNFTNNNIDFVEEMDWDPIDEESDAKFINEFCDQMDICKEILPDALDKVNSLNSSSKLSNSWILVPDTNIFVTDLNFIHEIKDTDVPDFGYPIIYVPWRVLRELDYLKDSKIDSHKKRLSLNARKSISYINENFKSRQSRFCGQSFEDFMNMVNMKISNPDDEILETCLKLKKQHIDEKVVLLTNDKNLESKAIVSNLEAYTKDAFKSKFLSRRDNFDKKEIDDSAQNNAVECDIKSWLNDFLSQVVKNEMEKAFGSDWIKICHKKPPWTLQDSLKSFMKHWRSVFFILFSKDVFYNAEELYKSLYKNKEGFSQNFSEMLNSATKLIESFKNVPKSYVPYGKLGDEILEKLSSLEKSKWEDASTDKFTQEKLPCSFVPGNSQHLANEVGIGSQSQSENFSNDFALVKDLFLNIWESLKSFCMAVFELVQQGELISSHQVAAEARVKLEETHTKVSTLISLLDLMVKVNSEDVSENHSLIIQMNDYLITLFSSMVPDVQKKLRKALVIFCSSLEGRSVMEKLLGELTTFAGYFVEAKNYLDSCFSLKS